MTEKPKSADETAVAPEDTSSGPRALRRGGARRELTDRVRLKGASEGRVFEGWSLNVSRGGVRIVTEGSVELGEEFEVTLGDEIMRAGRVVWLRQERDGVICGIEFIASTSGSGVFESVPPAPPGSLKLPGVPEAPESE